MKKVLLLVVALGMFVSCTQTELEDEPQAFEHACSAPDTNCNGNPDHCDDENGDPIPGCN